MAEKCYAILKTSKLNRSKPQEIKKRCEHTNRTMYAENVNQELSYLNKTVIGNEGADWFQLFKDRYKELEYYKQPDSRKLVSNAVVGIEAIATMSHSMKDRIDLDAWVEGNNKWMQDYFGKENVVHGVLHMDEATPHIHYFITPVKDGKFNAREIMGGRNKYAERQTSYAKAMEPYGLKRGLKMGNRLDAPTIQQLYVTINDVANAPEIFEQETAEEYRDRINKQYRDVQVLAKALQHENERLEITRDYAHDIENQLYELRKQFEKLKEEKDSLTIGGVPVKDIMAAVEHCPDKETIEAYISDLRVLAEFGASYNREHEGIEYDKEDSHFDSE